MTEIRTLPIDQVRPNPCNARVHSKKQVRQISNSILAFGFVNPLLVDEQFNIIAGHGRWQAGKRLGLETVRAIVLSGLSPAKKRALALADNKIAEGAGWDRQRLAIELPELSEILKGEGFTLAVTGFEVPEIDQLQVDFEEDARDPQDHVDLTWTSASPVSQPGTLWLLDQHRLLCGDARKSEQLDRLVGQERVAAAFLDPPYNLRVGGVVGRGQTRHREFAMASGEMSSQEYQNFLAETLGNAARVSRDGAVHFVCSDWRHVTDVIGAGQKIYGAFINLVVWTKTNAGQGSFYRSEHELIPVFRVGQAPHLNNVALGRYGRNRSNVWKYPGVNTFGAGRMDDLRSHPTVKPIALVADALKDCTGPSDNVLDTFLGSGTTIMAAERVGRRGYGMEIDPAYVDVAIRRWQAHTRKDAVEADSGRTFDEIVAERDGASSQVSDPNREDHRTGKPSAIGIPPAHSPVARRRPAGAAIR